MFQVLFFLIISCKVLCKNCLNLFFYKFTKIKIKSFECPKSIRNYIKNNARNIRHLVDESFVPANQRTSVLYYRLSDFMSPLKWFVNQDLLLWSHSNLTYLQGAGHSYLGVDSGNRSDSIFNALCRKICALTRSITLLYIDLLDSSH